MRRGDTYQYVLISSGVLATLLFGAFAYREMFPEYLIYQKDYVALEKFRSQYTGDPPPLFKEGVKQIVIEREDKGPALIDRCTSCHVALQIEDFSPTKIARDINGSIIYDKEGIPKKIGNPNYIWKKLKEAITAEQDPAVKAHLESLLTAEVGEFTYDVSKVLAMHPLMGRETRPFEFHPIEDYGCVSCHGGNGRGLVTDRAHGPVFDDQYEIEPEGFVPEFLEKDILNDPKFSKVFNSKPGHRLLFQTNPLYVGALIQAKCIQCHQSTQEILDGAKDTAEAVFKRKVGALQASEKSFQLEKARIIALLGLYDSINANGYDKTLAEIKKNTNDYTLPLPDREALKAQSVFLQNKNQQEVLQEIDKELLEGLGSKKMVQEFESSKDFEKTLEKNRDSTGTLFESYAQYNYSKELMKHLEDVSQLKQDMPADENAIGAIKTDVDVLTKDYQKGKALYISQGCYACHRIAGFARGGVGPELTKEGDSYPWFIKQSITWPQADLKTSTMPNMKLDHEELEALVTYLLAQTGRSKIISDSARKIAIQEWELGKKLPWEKPATEKQIHSLKYGMTVFAVEGCASCHRLSGYESNTGFKAEDPANVQWFRSLFPETILGSQIVTTIEKNSAMIDQKIGNNVRKDSLLEEIESTHPDAIEALYSNFKYALRAKNHESDAISTAWKQKVRMVLKMFVQTYGLGRVICPKLDWSGVMRSDQWLMEHFRAPTSRVPKSIMPVFPFDETKFYALTQTLSTLARRTVEKEKKLGFSPEPFYQEHCSQCHGDHLQGNGPVAEWLYPIPKNLRNPEFLRNLGKERAVQSIMHGVKGTPMAPWGEMGEGKSFNNDLPVLTEKETRQLVDWLFSGIPGGRVIRSETEVPKWNYSPEDVIQELKDEGNALKGSDQDLSFFSKGEPYIASLNPTFSNASNPIFDVHTNPEGGPDSKFYTIKQKYYTPENIEAGRHFFILNCASCHGTEADGAGTRAEAMSEAKPRMLVNLDWLESHDDLRLLRSIKYGVSGTSMTPWGDFSSSLQRLQVVIYIRSLSEGKVQKREMEQVLYQIFNEQIDKNPDSSLLKKERDIFYTLGNGFLNINPPNEILETYIKFVKNKDDPGISNALMNQIDQHIQDLQSKEETKARDAQISSWTKQKNLLTASLAELSRLKKQEIIKHDHAN